MNLFKFVPSFIITILVCIVIFYILLGALAFKSISIIHDKGLKNVIHQIWEGNQEAEK